MRSAVLMYSMSSLGVSFTRVLHRADEGAALAAAGASSNCGGADAYGV
jgi:hypothetical protein